MKQGTVINAYFKELPSEGNYSVGKEPIKQEWKFCFYLRIYLKQYFADSISKPGGYIIFKIKVKIVFQYSIILS